MSWSTRANLVNGNAAAYSRRVWLVVAALLTYILIYLIAPHYVQGGKDYDIGNRLRCVAVARIQVIIFVTNIFLHSQVMEYYENERGNYDKVSKLRCHRFMIFLYFCAHFIYFLYYAPPLIQLCFFEVANLMAGFWTNLFGFIAGFFLVRSAAHLCQMCFLTKKLIECSTRPIMIYALVYDRKTQIRSSFLIALVMSVMMYYSSDKIVIRRVTFPLKNLKEPVKLAMVSDIHAGASVYQSQVHRVVDAVLSESVDGVVLVGDMVDGDVGGVSDRLEPLWILPQRHPTFFVTGNHDYYYGNVKEWLDLYASKEIEILHNNHTMFHGICLAGVDDISSGKSGVPTHSMNASLALSGCPPHESAPRILLSHNPITVKEIPAKDLRTIDLVLSGHTHAAQFYVIAPLVWYSLPYFYGLYDLPAGEGHLFVSAGSLFQGPPMKMIAMSEVWIIDLIKA